MRAGVEIRGVNLETESGQVFTDGAGRACHLLCSIGELPPAGQNLVAEINGHRGTANPAQFTWVLADRAGEKLTRFLEKSGIRDAVVYPGPADAISASEFSALLGSGTIKQLLLDALPDELPASAHESLQRHRESLFFVPWTREQDATGSGNHPDANLPVCVVEFDENADDGITIRMAGDGDKSTRSPWTDFLGSLSGSGIIARRLSADGNPNTLATRLRESGCSGVAAASGNRTRNLLVAASARSAGMRFHDWAGVLSVQRVCIENAATWVSKGTGLPWPSLRAGVVALRRRPVWAGRILDKKPLASWIDEIGSSHSTDASSAGAINEIIRDALFAGDPRQRDGMFAWGAVVETGRAPVKVLTLDSLRAAATYLDRPSHELATKFAGVRDKRERIMDLLNVLIAHDNELRWLTIPFFMGVCDGHLTEWRHDFAKRIWGMAKGADGRAKYCEGLRLGLGLALGANVEFATGWKRLPERSDKLEALWLTMRIWMPLIETGNADKIPPESVEAWIGGFQELQADDASGDTSLLAVFAALYLTSSLETSTKLVGLSAIEGAGVAMSAWMLGKRELAQRVWDELCADHDSADVVATAPVVMARAIVERSRAAVVALEQLETRGSAYFEATCPSNTRCFLMALAWSNVGDITRAESWRKRALEIDGAAEARDAMLERWTSSA